MDLRPYQVNGIDQVRYRISSGKRRVLFVLATGGGKTVVAAHIIASAIALGSSVLFVAHRRELIKQCFAKLVRNGIPAEQIGIIMAGCPSGPSSLLEPKNDDELYAFQARRRPRAPVQIASIQTLQHRPTMPPADLLIVDEAHRALAPSYRKLFAVYPDAVHLGLTATPFGPGGKPLDVYEDLVVIASPRELIADGFLVEPRVFTVPAKDLPDLSRVKLSKGEYDATQLNIACNVEGLVGNIVETWQRRADNRRTVCFAASVAHSKKIAERFVAAGIAAEHLDGETDVEIREAILRRLETGETTVVVNCDVLCEGWDQPSVKCCILARPTKSTRVYLQQAGRILRPWNNVGALLLDHAGCCLEHGLPQDDREYSLEAKPKRKGSAVPCRACPECWSVLPPGMSVCPECGHIFEVARDAEPKEHEGELVEVREATFAEKRDAWLQICHSVIERGQKAGAAYYRYKELYGVRPPFKFPTQKLTDDQKREEFRRIVESVRRLGQPDKAAFVRYLQRFNERAPGEWLPKAETVSWAV